MIYITILLALAIKATSAASVEPFSPLADSESGLCDIYNQATAMTLDIESTFVINYIATKSIQPKVIVSLSGLEDRTDLSHSYLKVSTDKTSGQELVSFNLYSLGGASSSIFYIGISYMALVDQHNAIYVLPQQFNSLNNLNQGSGDRSQSRSTNFFLLTNSKLNSDLTKNVAAVYISGFEIMAPNTLSLSYTMNIASDISFNTIISTSGDCLIKMLFFNYLIVNKGAWEAASPPITILTTSTTTTIELSYYFSEANNMLGWIGVEGLSSNKFKFSYSVNSGSSTVVSNTSNGITSIDFLYVFIGEHQCPDSYPYYQTVSQALCVDQCSSSETSSPSSGICSSCDSNCKRCSDLPTTCTSCSSGFVVEGNVCVQEPEKVESMCKAGETLSGGRCIDNKSLLGLLALLVLIPGVGLTSNILLSEAPQNPDDHLGRRPHPAFHFFLNNILTPISLIIHYSITSIYHGFRHPLSEIPHPLSEIPRSHSPTLIIAVCLLKNNTNTLWFIRAFVRIKFMVHQNRLRCQISLMCSSLLS